MCCARVSGILHSIASLCPTHAHHPDTLSPLPCVAGIVPFQSRVRLSEADRLADISNVDEPFKLCPQNPDMHVTNVDGSAGDDPLQSHTVDIAVCGDLSAETPVPALRNQPDPDQVPEAPSPLPPLEMPPVDQQDAPASHAAVHVLPAASEAGEDRSVPPPSAAAAASGHSGALPEDARASSSQDHTSAPPPGTRPSVDRTANGTQWDADEKGGNGPQQVGDRGRAGAVSDGEAGPSEVFPQEHPRNEADVPTAPQDQSSQANTSTDPMGGEGLEADWDDQPGHDDGSGDSSGFSIGSFSLDVRAVTPPSPYVSC